MIDSERFTRAATRFKAFFDELRTAFVEREDVLAQIALALLAKEHVLLTGPPGTAKSQIASAVFGRIVCEETGSPSLFARQITESTVQTDLIGPVDFKTLTETGRTTHFTDEGILGSAHAFLDEVFDGRDMLLRSTLNVLNERELKQGGTITRGRTEVALLTSNRYVSEVLEDSRETLLAFVDRVAFVSFVPRSFADPESLAIVLKRRVAGGGRPSLDALLTIQDLDVLQAAVAETWVAPELCDAVAALLARFDAESSAAVRADPSFVPTRYLSTRTAVRCAELLRAAAVYQRIFEEPSRKLDARYTDLALLRLHLVLAGPKPADIERILERESDPVERRQLEILRTERELFDACLEKLERRALTPRPKPTEQPPEQAAAQRGARSSFVRGQERTTPEPQAAPEAPPKGPLDVLEEQLANASARADDEALARIARELAEAARTGAPDEARARALLDRSASALASLALSESLRLSEPETDLLGAARRLAKLASSLEDGSVSMHASARFLHERALSAVGDVASHGLGLDAATLLGASGDASFDATRVTERILSAASELAELRRELLARSSSRSGEEGDERWSAAMDRVESELVALWSLGFAETLAAIVDVGGGRSLGDVLGVLRPELTRLEQLDEHFGRISGRRSSVKARVVGPRLAPLVRASLGRCDLADRAALLTQVEELSGTLAAHGLGSALGRADWLGFVAEALRGAEPARRKKPKRLDKEGYRALRSSEQRTPILSTLAEVALRVSQSGTHEPGGELSATLGALPVELALEVARLDLARTERAVDFLQRWWAELVPEGRRPSSSSALEPLLELAWDEAALTRFALEARLVEQLVPSAAEQARALRERIDALDAVTRAASLAMVEARAEAVFQRTLAPA